MTIFFFSALLSVLIGLFVILNLLLYILWGSFRTNSTYPVTISCIWHNFLVSCAYALFTFDHFFVLCEYLLSLWDYFLVLMVYLLESCDYLIEYMNILFFVLELFTLLWDWAKILYAFFLSEYIFLVFWTISFISRFFSSYLGTIFF